ncbi:hypothetical protein ACLBR5_05405 [Escherichia coli]
MPTTQCDVKRCQPDGHRAASAEVVLDPDDGIAGDTNGYGATHLQVDRCMGLVVRVNIVAGKCALGEFTIPTW